jgi:hypothetical protein
VTIPTGTQTMNDIRTEYGLSGALALGSLYAGGSIIAAGAGGYYGAIPSSGAIALRQFGGHSAPPSALDTQTVTIGSGTIYYTARVGYQSAFSLGSISDGTSNLYSGASITGVMWSGGSQNNLSFSVTATQANSGWTTMTVNGNSYARTSATYYSSTTSWQWSGVTSNPFGATSGTKVVTWT